jgi:hypothetical protein
LFADFDSTVFGRRDAVLVSQARRIFGQKAGRIGLLCEERIDMVFVDGCVMSRKNEIQDFIFRTSRGQSSQDRQ